MNRDLSRTRAKLGGILIAAAFAVGACSSAATPAATAATTAASSAAPTSAPTGAPTRAAVAPTTQPSVAAPSVAPTTAVGGPSVEIDVATGATLGKYIAGTGGLTLYSYKPDAAAPGTSTCNDQCAATWPPLTITAGNRATAGNGASGTIATITRDDGTSQVTYQGVPLYYFKGDAAAGDTSGNGTNDVWFVVAP